MYQISSLMHHNLLSKLTSDPEIINRLWERVYEMGEKHGYRNAQVSLLAPTGTIAFAMDCDSTSSEPFFSHIVYKKLVDNSWMKLVNRVIPQALKQLGYTDEQIEAIEKIYQALGINYVTQDTIETKEGDSISSLTDEENDKPNIEIVLKYFSYREISTDDLFTIIQDLRDENLEVCVLILDYIKRIRPSTPVADNVKLELNRVINELKALAVIMDIPVVTAHQMNRVAASTVDSAARAGQGDVTKLVGREHTGDALITSAFKISLIAGTTLELQLPN